MRERRRQLGLPLPVADKVLPFRLADSEADIASGGAGASDLLHSAGRSDTLFGDDGEESGPLGNADHAERHMREAFAALVRAEASGAPRRTLDTLEEAYASALATYGAAQEDAGYFAHVTTRRYYSQAHLEAFQTRESSRDAKQP